MQVWLTDFLAEDMCRCFGSARHCWVAVCLPGWNVSGTQADSTVASTGNLLSMEQWIQ